MNRNRETFSITHVRLDANGEPPSRIPLLITGDWPNSVKGKFKVTLDDLKEVKANFDNKVGFPTDDATTGLACDYKHEFDDEAAFWWKGMEIDANEQEQTGTLYATQVEWTPGGIDAIKSGRFKCISPMGFFGSKNGKPSIWSKPTDQTVTSPNVIEGAGLTNIPFLQGMKPIRADAIDDQDAYGKLRNNDDGKGNLMTLEAIREKLSKSTGLSEDEKKFATDHKDDFSKAEKIKLGLETADVDPEKVTLDKSAYDDIKAKADKLDRQSSDTDRIVMSKEQLDQLTLDAKAGRKAAEELSANRADQVVAKHVKRGAIKQDQAETWSKQLVSAGEDTDLRKTLETTLDNLPTNSLLNSPQGDGDPNAGGGAYKLLKDKTEEIIKASKEADTNNVLPYDKAMTMARSQNPELVKQYLEELKSGEVA